MLAVSKQGYCNSSSEVPCKTSTLFRDSLSIDKLQRDNSGSFINAFSIF